MNHEPPQGLPSPVIQSHTPLPLDPSLVASARSQARPHATPVRANRDDVASIDAIVRALYECVSFTDGAGPDEARLASLLTADAKLIAVQPSGATLETDARGFVARVRERIQTTGLMSFVERELFRRTEVYAAIAHVFSSYEGRTSRRDGELLVRGINSIQLRHDGARWWILSVLWTDEHAGNPIPAAYLPRSF